MSLESLEKKILRELAMINYPPSRWRIAEPVDMHDVVIIGGGMAGMMAAFALLKQGISKIQIIDAAEEGKEGPWDIYARMKTLRSPKHWRGPAIDFPSLTPQAWYEAKYGSDAWEKLGKISTADWMEYLKWYRNVLKLPIQNSVSVTAIVPENGHFRLKLSNGEISTRKVVLATGMSGFGGYRVPSFIHEVPKERWAHTSEFIDFPAIKGQRIAIVGAGSSGFDNAAEALENGAESVDMYMRRARLPNVNKEKSLYYPGMFHGFYHLPDEEKWKIYTLSSENGVPPPKEALDRIHKFHNFRIHCQKNLQKFGDFDFIILATGYDLDGAKQPELGGFMDKILLWKDRGFTQHSRMGNFPYLGPHFEFLEKTPGTAPYLKDLHCFNRAATLSHASLSGDIPGIPIGAARLAEGIAIDFLLRDREAYCKRYKDYSDPDFHHEDYTFFHE